MTNQRFAAFSLLFCAVLLPACMAAAPPSSSAPSEPSPVAAPPSPDNATVITLRHTGVENSITHLGAVKFKETLEQSSDGRFLVDIYPENALGNTSDAEYALRYGTVTMHMGTPLFQALDCLAWSALSGEDKDSLRTRLGEGPLRELLEKESAENGLRYLGILSTEYYLMSSNRPIQSLGDFQALKVASPGAAQSQAFWTALGAKTIDCPEEQVFTALQQKVIDARENVQSINLLTNYLSYQPYLVLTNHRIYSRAAYINQRFYSDLPPHEQRLIDDAVAVAGDYLTTYIDAYFVHITSGLKEKGIEIQTLSPELRAGMNEAARHAVLRALEAEAGKELMDTLSKAFPES